MFHIRFLSLVGAYLLISCAAAERTYTVTAPKNVRPRTPYQAVVTVHNTPEPVKVAVNVSCTREGSKTPQVVTGDITVADGDTKILSLDIGDWKRGSCEIVADGSEGIVFHRSAQLNFNGKLASVFIQTDKAIYQPGQLVQFRVLVVDSNLKPYKSDKLDIHIKDAQGNRIKQWNNVTLERGIFSEELQLSDQPVLGDWSINAKIEDEDVSKQFTVAEYVLPKFEVTVRPPPFSTYNDSEIVVAVDAKYTYGKPVKGTVMINGTEPYCRSRYTSYCGSTPVVITTKIDGTATARFPIDNFGFRDYYKHGSTSLDFLAVVTEELTGRQMNSTGVVTIYPRKEKIDLEQSSNTFKPGLRHTVIAKLQLQDNTPINNADEPLKVTYSTKNYKPEISENYTIPPNGIVTIDTYPIEDSDFFRLTAEYKGVQNSISASKAASISSKYLQLSMNKKNPKVGDTVDIEVNGTFYISRLDYEVVARGKILKSGSLKFDKDAKYQKFPLELTQDMAPRTRIVTSYVSTCGEVVVDSLDFAVDGVFRTPVELSTSENRTKPGAPIDVTVETKPDALVGLLAIDQSVLLLKSGNDITKNQIISDLDGYESGWRPSSYDRKKRYIWRPPGENPEQLYDNAGLIFFSNGLFQKQSSGYGYDRFYVSGMAGPPGAPEVAFRPMNSPTRGSAFSTSSPSGPKPRVRKNFVETWIWDSLISSKDGKAVLQTTVPDTITSWVISAFAMDDENGLGLADGPAKVEVFRPFFVSLNLPYSVVRGETVSIQALVFNYMKEDLEAQVTLENPDDQFELVGLQNRVDVKDNSSETKTVKVKAGDGSSVSFLITPKVVGHIDLKVTAMAPKASDALIRKLLVKAEGSPQYFNKALLIDLRNTSEFSEKVDVNIPDFAVKDSEFIEISAIGDIMGPTVNNLDKLLRMPYGCGEQNMVNFVPNIVVADYLNTTGQLTDEIKSKAVKHMESGYQRELTYKRNDGSFSAFGNSDKNGSTWLTAFVARSFHEAKPYISVDDNVIVSSLDFLANLQQKNGSFPEFGEVHNRRLQGGAAGGIGLTAFVLLAFLENKDQTKFANVTLKARELLELELIHIEDPYDLAIVTYALSLADSPDKNAAFEKLMKKADKKDGRLFWTKPEPPRPANQSIFYYPPPSVDIEMTSYGLLSQLLHGTVADAIPIMRWLVSQRNENGGFASTQDTVLGIQALAEMASHIVSPPNSKIDVDFSYNKRTKRMTMEKSNALVLQKEELPKEVREIDVKASGTGVGIVQITWSYNLDNSTTSPVFDITPTVKQIDGNSFDLTVCTIYEEKGESSNMAVVEINLPSGYTADSDSLPSRDQLSTLKRVETNNGGTKVDLYFDQINDIPICPHVTAYKSFNVANVKPAAIAVYDYYDNAKRSETFYEAPATSVCDICSGDECSKDCKSKS